MHYAYENALDRKPEALQSCDLQTSASDLYLASSDEAGPRQITTPQCLSRLSLGCL